VPGVGRQSPRSDRAVSHTGSPHAAAAWLSAAPGTAVATVTAAGITVTVEFPIHCTSNQGG
jgi:hypothetical protein